MANSIVISEEAGVRYLHFGSSWIQGAMRIARPHALELPYTRDMMLALLLRCAKGRSQWPRHVLMVGLGSGSLVKFLYRYRPRASLVVVEIDPHVVAAAHQFFKLPQDPKRMHIEIGDGWEYMADARRRFDLVVVDGFDAKGRAGMLDAAPFYCNSHARLTDRGLLVANLLTRNRGIGPSVERMSEAFAGRVRALPRSAGGNSIVVAAAGERIDVSFAELDARAKALHKDSGLNLAPTVTRLRAARGGDRDSFEL